MPQLFERSFGLSALPFLRPRVNPVAASTDVAEAPAAAISRELLAGCATTLGPFIQDSEAALAKIGAVMADLFDGAVHIRAEAEGARDSIASMVGNANAQLLEIKSALERSTTQLQGNRALLEALDHRLAAIVRDFAGLEAGVREFRVVGTLIRIEAHRPPRHDTNGRETRPSSRAEASPSCAFSFEGSTRAADSDAFVTISERSATITADLGELVDQIRLSTADLRQSFRNISREIQRLTATSLLTITNLIADVAALEKVMTGEHHAINTAAGDTLAGLERIRNTIGELVCALQIHDILRQQSEHSLVSIDDLHRRPALPAADRLPCQAVVQAQITHTLSLCQDASANVESGLDTASRQLADIDILTGNVSRLTQLDSPSRRAVQASTSAILAALPVIEKGDAALEKALDDLRRGTASIRSIVTKVSLTMIDMRWLGLNATIQSANRPQPGSAIETLGSRTATIVDTVDQDCLNIRAALDQLCLDIDNYSRSTVGTLGQNSIRHVAETSITLFDSVHHSIRSAMEAQARLQQSLQSRLTLAQTALIRFRDTQSPPARAVARLAQQQPSLPLPVPLSPAAAALLDAWFARYTMASERRVHCLALGLPCQEAENEAPPEGDIELF